MRYEGTLYRPPSEAESYIVQATIGCSWNHCTYCDMYRDKDFRVRELDETLADLREASESFGERVRKVFIADGDALILDMDHWEPILETCRELFPKLRRVSCYAMASNVLEKTDEGAAAKLRSLQTLLTLLDDPTTASNAASELERLEDVRRYQATFWVRAVVGYVLMDLERWEEAVPYLRTWWFWTNANMNYHLARAYESMGEYEKAAKEYAFFIEAWADADPELQPWVEDARRALERLAPDR